MKKPKSLFQSCAALALSAFLLANYHLKADEYYIGEPVIKQHLEIVPNYLLNIQMDKMPPGMEMGKNTIHLEVDVHASKGETHGFASKEWIPYLTVHFIVTKEGSTFKKTGELFPMTATDGPHYANNIKMDGPGKYHLTYVIDPPSSNGFIRHTNKPSGVPKWWNPIRADWDFVFPGKKKAD